MLGFLLALGSGLDYGYIPTFMLLLHASAPASPRRVLGCEGHGAHSRPGGMGVLCRRMSWPPAAAAQIGAPKTTQT